VVEERVRILVIRHHRRRPVVGTSPKMTLIESRAK
jgi:hypothetical protein